MNIHESAEDYLERILMLSERLNSVRSIDIARDMGYSKPSISRAIKNLKENDYIKVSETGDITLTEKGHEVASSMYERHLLLTNYLIKLGVDEEIARADACKIEHDISKETFEAIKKHVNKYLNK